MSERFTPRYYEIEQQLRSAIAELRTGDLLPSETELAAAHHVSRMTARAAVQRLVAEGLVYRRPGRGTFVADSRAERHVNQLPSFTSDMRRRGRVPSSRMVRAGLFAVPAARRSPLGLTGDGDVVEIVRVRLADQVSIAVEEAIFRPDCLGLLDADLESGSLHAALVRLGRVPTAGTSSISSVNASVDDAQHLQVPVATALLVERRVIFDQNQEVLEVTESRYVGSRYALEVGFDVDRDAHD